MRKNLILLAALAMSGAATAGDWTSPNTGKAYTFEALSTIEGTGVEKFAEASSPTYLVSSNLSFGTSDTLRIQTGDLLKLGDGVLIEVKGHADFAAGHEGGTKITRSDESANPKGIQVFDDQKASGVFKNIYFEYVGIRYSGYKPLMVDSCEFHLSNGKLNSSGVISFYTTRGANTVTNSIFKDNVVCCIGGGANYTNGLVFENNYLENNNTENRNKPQINLTVGGDESIVISGNTIIGNKRESGNMVGGIAVANMLGLSGSNKVYITNNDIRYNRYGITTMGSLDAVIENNKIIDNHYESNAMNGGSGISISDSQGKQKCWILGNEIVGNLWGVTIIGGSSDICLGKIDDSNYVPGHNHFYNNGNNGELFDVYNNGTSTIYAQGNLWGVDEMEPYKIENVITHKTDNKNLGEVVYQPTIELDAPHSVTAEANFQKVTLNWKNPNDEKRLTWSTDYAYNGDAGKAIGGNSYATFFAGNYFSASDLQEYVGERVSGLRYYEYRPVMCVYAAIFERPEGSEEWGEEPVCMIDHYPTSGNFHKDTYRTIDFSQSYQIKAGVDMLFVIGYLHGSNMDMVAIKDNLKNNTGKGDWYSYDAKNWACSGNGNYLISAVLENNSGNWDINGYGIFRDGEKVADTDSLTFSYTLDGESKAKHHYQVAALVKNHIYEKSRDVVLDIKTPADCFPTVNFTGTEVNDFEVKLTWQAPLNGANSLTWGGETLSQNIGGTATSNTKVWVKNEFDGYDMIPYVGRTLNSISIYLVEKVILANSKLVVFKDGVVDYYQDLTAEQIDGIVENSWNSFALDTPYTIEAGHTYAYGFYFLHTPKMHPIGVSAGASLTKGNQFSISSASSTFKNSKPSWKTLASGNIPGCWMMKAEMSAAAEGAPSYEVASYEFYQDGKRIASEWSDAEFVASVSKPGTYKFGVVAVAADGRKSEIKEISVNVDLPALYAAPVIEEKNFDAEHQTVSFAWSQNTELKHYGTATYFTGFSEEITLKWGAKFSKAQLASLVGKQISKIKFAIGEKFGNFKVGVYNASGVALSEEEILADDIDDLTFYNISLTNPVTITGQEDLYIAYSGTLPANANGLLIDAGPLKEGGAMVNLGGSWMKLGTIAPSVDDYNIVIAATVTSAAAQAPAQHQDNELKVISYNIYRDNYLWSQTENCNFSEQLDNYGKFCYAVSAVYSDGNESNLSESFKVYNATPQYTDSPVNLTASTEASEGALQLTWEESDKCVAGYAPQDDVRMALGMTGSGTREGYAIIRVPDYATNQIAVIEKIRFDLTDVANIQTFSVVVTVGENIYYEQEVDVTTLVDGVNEICLDQFYDLALVNEEVGVGYHLTYPNGVKPMVTDNGPAVRNYGDIITGSASAGYFYSLATKYNVDRNWRIWAVLNTAIESNYDAPASRDDQTGNSVVTNYPVNYNVYCNDELIASGINEKTYSLTEAQSGSYTVTANIGGRESAPSNAVIFTNTGIEAVRPARLAGDLYNLNGQKVATRIRSEILIEGNTLTITGK